MTVYHRSDIYWEEKDISQAVAAVATSVGVIIGAFKKGPISPRLVTNVNAFNDKYGNADARISYAGYAGQAFLESSRQMWVRRVVGCCPEWGGVVLHSPDFVEHPETAQSTLQPFTVSYNPDTEGFDWDELGPVGSTGRVQENLLAIYYEGPGSFSKNLEIELVSENLRVPTITGVVDYTSAGVIIDKVEPGSGTLEPDYYQYAIAPRNRTGNTVPSETSFNVVSAGQIPYIQWTGQPGAIGTDIFRKKDSDTTWTHVTTVAQSKNYYLDTGVAVRATNVELPTGSSASREFTLNVYDLTLSKNQPFESWGVSLSDYTNGMGRQTEIQQVINGVSKRIRVQINLGAFLDEPLIYSTGRVAMGTGNSGEAIMSSDVILAWNEFADDEDKDVRLLINAGYSTPSIQLKMDSICQTRQDCVAVLDIPSHLQEPQSAIDYRNNVLSLSSSRSAIYTSDVLIEDPYTNKRLYIPPSGHVAGAYAYTDEISYPWRAPAGLNRAMLRVLGIRRKYDKTERDMLHQNQINYIRDFRGIGRAVWEQRTLQVMQSGLSFMNVRRLLDNIAMVLKSSLLWQEFEPNDDFLRLQIKTLINKYLEMVHQARGLNQYLVICDESNNEAYYTNLGQLNIDLMLEPTLPAEKLRVRGILTAQGVEFTDLIAAGALS